MSETQIVAQTKRFRVVVIEWLSYDAVIEAADATAAEERARQFWANNAENQIFDFDDSGIDGVYVEGLS